MGRYDSHKNPFSYVLNQWAHRKTTNQREQEPKSMPASVKQIEKDFLHMNFETKNSIFTPPVMKMPQSFSRFGREPTQSKDMGLAVPGDYYNGGMTAFSGGGTNFYPRGNLSSLTFQPMSNLKAPSRDYDQHWETGGPNGWRCKVQEKQQEGGQGSTGNGGGSSGGGGGASPQIARARQRVMQSRSPITLAASNGSGGQSGGSGGQQQQQQQDYTEFSFDKNGQAIMQSKDKKHYLKVDQQSKKIMLTGEGDSTIFGKNNAYLNSGGGMCVVNPSGESEESGAGWDAKGGSGGSSGSSGGGSATPAVGSATPFAGGGGGGKVYLGGDPKKDKFCLVQTICGPSKNVYAKVG
jgi:hypothetical protein